LGIAGAAAQDCEAGAGIFVATTILATPHGK